MSYDEIQQNRARRLHQLKKRQALEGPETPVHVSIEIADLEASGVHDQASLDAAQKRDLAMPAWFSLYVIVSAWGVSAALLIGVLDFILILVLRGH